MSYVERKIRRSVLVYHVTWKHKITDLEIFARKYIEYFGGGISTFEILRSARKVFSKLPENVVWLPGFDKKVMQRSFMSGNRRFNIDDLSGI